MLAREHVERLSVRNIDADRSGLTSLIFLKVSEVAEMASKRLVIIGGVAAGPKAAAKARRCDPEMEITIVEKGEFISYAGCGLPYYIAGAVKTRDNLMDTALGQVRTPEFFKKSKNIDVLIRHEAKRIDRARKVVEAVNLETGETIELPYDKLILATGAKALIPPIPGIDAKNIFGLHQVEEAVEIRRLIEEEGAKKAVVVGGGYIGLETAEGLVEQGVEVTVVEKMPQVLINFDPEFGGLVAKHLRQKGVNLLLNEEVTGFEADEEGRVKTVKTTSQELPADLVVVGIGVRPNVQLAQDAGLEVGRAIKVNPYLQTTDPDIYAAGDCVETVDRLTGLPTIMPLGSTANKMGRVAGTNVAGGRDTFPGVVKTMVVKIFDYNVGRVGMTEREAREAGYEVVTAIVPAPDRAHYYPTHKTIILKLVVNALNGKLLGLQAAGPGDTVKRIDVAATAITFGADVTDIANLDLAYAPPFSSAMDPLITAANVVRNKMEGRAQGVSPLEVKEKLDRGDDFILLDVRNPDELDAQGRIPGALSIPLPELKTRLSELPKEKEIVAFCKVSLRGYAACLTLQAKGYQDVKFMDGGAVAWPFELK